MARHRDFRNMDYDDLSGDEDDDQFGSLGTSYGSMNEFYAPPSLSYDSLIPDTPSGDDRYEDDRPYDHEILGPALDEIEPILGDSFSLNQLISALREKNYDTQSAIDWLMDDGGNDQDGQFDFEEDDDGYFDYQERVSVHAGASIFANTSPENPPGTVESTTTSSDGPSQSKTERNDSEASNSSPASIPVPEVIPKVEKQTIEHSPSSLANVLCHSSMGEQNSLGVVLSSRIFPSLHHSPDLPLPPPSEPLDSDIIPFQFDSPSPDDFVLQRQATSKPNSKSNVTTKQPAPQKAAEPFKPIVVGSKKKNNKQKVKKAEPEPKQKVDTKPKTVAPKVEAKEEPEAIAQLKEQDLLPKSITDSPKVIIPRPKKSIKQMDASTRTKITESVENSSEKPHLNLVCVGHVDAGKSTTMGHLLLELGNIDQRTIHKYRKLANEEGKASFVYAWVLDEHMEERTRGVTIDVGLNFFETKTKRITLLDAPGHKEFVPNMITGAAQADAAILFVDATVGEFETGITDDGQTKEHTVLLRSLGVDKLLVAVNKLDMVDYSQDRYNFIVDELRKFLKQAGYRQRGIRFVPCSGFHAENLVKRSEEKLCCWYSGDTLVEAIDALEKPSRTVDTPFRVCVTDVFKNIGLGLAVSGKINSGIVGTGDQLLVIPGYEICSVKAIEIQDKSGSYASAGDSVSLGLNGIDMSNIGIGHFLCDPQKPIPYTNRFMAKIITFKVKYPITKGSSVTMQYQNVTVEGTIIRLLELLDKTSGAVAKKNPRSINDSTAALVAIRTEQPICIETFSQNKELGRFTLRDDGQTIATGVITKLLQRRA